MLPFFIAYSLGSANSEAVKDNEMKASSLQPMTKLQNLHFFFLVPTSSQHLRFFISNPSLDDFLPHVKYS